MAKFFARNGVGFCHIKYGYMEIGVEMARGNAAKTRPDGRGERKNMTKINEIMQDSGNDPDEIIRISRNPKPGTGEIEILWRGTLRNIPSEYQDRDCEIGWSAGENVFDLTLI